MVVSWENEEIASKVYGRGKVVLMKAERVTRANLVAAERAWCMPEARPVLQDRNKVWGRRSSSQDKRNGCIIISYWCLVVIENSLLKTCLHCRDRTWEISGNALSVFYEVICLGTPLPVVSSGAQSAIDVTLVLDFCLWWSQVKGTADSLRFQASGIEVFTDCLRELSKTRPSTTVLAFWRFCGE